MTMEPRRLGRPRDTTRDAEILQAAREELAERGYERMTMAAVAARAGAGKATVYRRWASKAELVIDAVACTADAALTLEKVPDTGSLSGDLRALRALKHHDEGVWLAMAGLVSELPHAPELASVVHDRLVRPRVGLVRGLLERAARRGELMPGINLDLLATVPPAMIAYRLLVSGEPLDTDFLVRLSDEIFMPLATGVAVPQPVG
ncbi:MAG TPA: TetR/AcrR family transcriptional regulator [Cellulomonas sp.]